MNQYLIFITGAFSLIFYLLLFIIGDWGTNINAYLLIYLILFGLYIFTFYKIKSIELKSYQKKALFFYLSFILLH